MVGMVWIWVAVAGFVVMVAAAAISDTVKDWRAEKAALPKISISHCRKCGEVLGPQKRETITSYPGANLHFVVTCGHCGARFNYSRRGDFECER
jgi:hypothetical protein